MSPTQANGDGAGPSAPSMKLGAVAGATIYSVSGTLLTLINKLAIQMFPYACLLILIQNAMTIILLLSTPLLCTSTFGKLTSPNLATLVRWAPLSCLFVVMLLSSMLALKYISAVSLVVLRNLTTIIVAVGERYILGTRFSWPAVATLWGMLFGASIYGASDLLFHAKGYAWLLVNIISSSTYQIYVKMLAKDDSLSPLDMSYISNVISLPVLALCSVAMREIGGRDVLIELVAALAQPAVMAIVFASGVLGYTLSTSAFLLNKLISATAIMVINNANKFAVILLSEIFMERSLGVMSTTGTLLVLYFAYMYAKCPKLPASAPEAESTVADCVTIKDDSFISSMTGDDSVKTTVLYVSVACSWMLALYTLLSKPEMQEVIRTMQFSSQS
jgi:GDP-mannose transporter